MLLHYMPCPVLQAIWADRARRVRPRPPGDGGPGQELNYSYIYEYGCLRFLGCRVGTSLLLVKYILWLKVSHIVIIAVYLNYTWKSFDR